MFKCNGCGNGINPEGGVIVQGNIYAVGETSDERGGLVGNAFPKPDQDGKILVSDIREYVFCWFCFDAALYKPKRLCRG